MTLVVDASVALKWFVAEDDSDVAVRILSSGRPLVAPDLIVAELCNAAWRLLQRGELATEQAHAIGMHAGSLLSRRVPLGSLAERAIRLAVTLQHPAYDCFYLALAEIEDTQVVTSDRRLLQRVAKTPWAERVADLHAYGSAG